MSEDEWLRSNDPAAMMRFLWTTGKLSERKGRLFAVACCHRVCHNINQKGRRAVDAAERFADDESGNIELMDARHVASSPRYAGDVAALSSTHPYGGDAACESSYNASLAAGSLEQQRTERSFQVALARCIVGNPFLPISIEASLLTDRVMKLAGAIYDERAFDRLPILADLLEENGCREALLLEHLRGPGPHCRGCWALDAVLGKG
jgi:hypothetical protein